MTVVGSLCGCCGEVKFVENLGAALARVESEEVIFCRDCLDLPEDVAEQMILAPSRREAAVFKDEAMGEVGVIAEDSDLDLDMGREAELSAVARELVAVRRERKELRYAASTLRQKEIELARRLLDLDVDEYFAVEIGDGAVLVHLDITEGDLISVWPISVLKD